MSSSEIGCVSPKVPSPGYVDLMIALYPGLYSSPVEFLYYQKPEVYGVDPASGPEMGYSQL